MWFLGALAGGAIGAVFGHGVGFIPGAVIGGIIGAVLGLKRADRLNAFEKRIAALESALNVSSPAAQPVAEVFPARPSTAQRPETAAQPPQPRPEPQAPLARETPPVAKPPPPAPQPSQPSGPALWERLVGGNLVAKVGILILFIGLAFLVKYAYERIHAPIELRLTGVAIGAIVLLALGWRLRLRRPGYALILQGGGVAILYLVIYAAFRRFGLLPAPLAFFLLVGVAAASAALAIAQNSLTLAVVGVTGGFLAPVLASTGRGDHVILFSYYAVLNAGIVAVAWMKAWRVLNVLGFVFTFVIGWAWGAKSYTPEVYASTQPFLILFFAMYLAIPLLFARRRAIELKDYVDGTLVFGVPVVAFGLQAAIARHIEYGVAWSALALAAVYLALAWSLFRRAGPALRLLVESAIALSLAFATLAIPLAFDGRLTSAVWALEGAAVVWVATRQGRLLARCFGYLLQFAGGIAFLSDVGSGYGRTPVLNSFWLGATFIAVASLFCARYVEQNRGRLRAEEGTLATVLLVWGALWWYGGGIHEVLRQVALADRGPAVLIFVAASSVAFSFLATLTRWPTVRWLWLLLYPAMVGLVLVELERSSHPFAGIGAVAWIGAFAVHFALLARHAADPRPLLEWLHAAGVWLGAVVGAREVGWLIDTAVEGKRVWPAISWAIVPAAILLVLASARLQKRWPVSAYPQSYVVAGGAPLAVFLALWTFHANFGNDGDPYPLSYMPFLNPLDLAMATVFLVLARWLAELPRQGLQAWWDSVRVPIFAAFGLGIFVWINGSLLRTLHHWTGLPFALQPMLSSVLVQAAFSILWTLIALGAMIAATRRALRPLWIVGAGLMGVVVVKLFLVDLSGVGTVERIVSFIVVGVLMLLVGYFSPVPPRAVVSNPAASST
jgi:uncharacterized membrane protein